MSNQFEISVIDDCKVEDNMYRSDLYEEEKAFLANQKDTLLGDWIEDDEKPVSMPEWNDIETGLRHSFEITIPF